MESVKFRLIYKAEECKMETFGSWKAFERYYMPHIMISIDLSNDLNSSMTCNRHLEQRSTKNRFSPHTSTHEI